MLKVKNSQLNWIKHKSEKGKVFFSQIEPITSESKQYQYKLQLQNWSTKSKTHVPQSEM